MSNNKRRFVALASLYFLLFPILAIAQEREERIDSPYRWIENRLRLGLTFGYHAADRGNLDFGQGPTPIVGGRFRVRISSPLSLEVGASYGPAERFVIDPREPGGPAVIDTVAAGWLRTEVGIQLGLTGARTWNGIHPYVLFGGGWVFGVDEGASATFADPALIAFRYDISTAPLLYAGFGFEVFPSEKLGIGFELRDYLIRVSTPPAYFQQEVLDNLEAAGASAPESTQWPHNLEPALVFWWYP